MTVENAGPYLFLGLQGGGPPCGTEPDPLPGPNLDNSVGGIPCYPGGGPNSSTFWSPSANAFVPTPNRFPDIAQHWKQGIYRITTGASGETDSPLPTTSAADVIDATGEITAAGMISLIETHDFTGSTSGLAGTPVKNWPIIPAGYTSDMATPTPGGYQSFADQVVFWDAIIQGLNGNNYAWFNFLNEPIDGTITSADGPGWEEQATFWIERTRLHHGSDNIIVIDLAAFGQDLGNLAAGEYDLWWDGLKNHSSGRDLTMGVILGWHAYGARRLGVNGTQYTYADMDSDIATAKAKGFPILVGEYGQSVQVGTGNAGPDAWNRTAVQYLVTENHGPRLVDKHGLMFMVWIATGDTAFYHLYKLTQGPTPGVDDGLSTPFWDITAADTNLLEPLGLWHGQASGAW